MTRPLESLVQANDEIEEQLLADVLAPFMTFTQAGEIIPKRAFTGLDTQEKILAILPLI